MLRELKLPANVKQYRQTNMFSTDTAPQGFLKDHSTKAGVWGLLVVHRGNVDFVDEKTHQRRSVTAGEDQVIAPESVHRIQLSDDARFLVEFYKVFEDNI